VAQRRRTPDVGPNRLAGAPQADALAQRFASFVADRFPFALERARAAYAHATAGQPAACERDIEALRPRLREEFARHFPNTGLEDLPTIVPDAPPAGGVAAAVAALAEACDGYLRREAIAASLTPEDKREILRGMILTRAVDNQLKGFFLGSEIKFEGAGFQGKGFRSLGQEAVYAAPLRLRRGEAWRTADGSWTGDVVAPLIRDLGAALAMRSDDDAVFAILNAQMGKAGPPMDGRDFHIGDPSWGILPASAPLAIPSLTVAGMAMSFALAGRARVAVSFIGEGGSSLGEWHEAINACAARRLPAVFCIENNRTALSTPVADQSAGRTFADKAAGYGIPGVTIDGCDPEAIAAAFGWAAERARAGFGPALLELVSMRMCGHAHHDDMLYLGKEPRPSREYPEPDGTGYVDAEAYRRWRARDPIAAYAARLTGQGILSAAEVSAMWEQAEKRVREQARRLVDAPWPDAALAGARVVHGEPPRLRRDPLEARGTKHARSTVRLPEVEAAPPFDPRGATFLEGVMRGVGDALDADPRVFVYGQDVGSPYGNAFLLLRPLLERHGARILNSILAEGAVLGVAVGAALAGHRPIAEIQFNDFVATGFNQLVNNAAKIRYRWGGSVPMVVRMPWGGLRSAGPYHSQNTEPWFYRTPGLKIVVPSTPHDARALMAAAVADPDPVLYYEHIALYRDPRIKQRLADAAPGAIPLGRAALRRTGSDLGIVSWGAYVHVALRVAERLAKDGVDAAVLDLRTLAPLDRETLLAVSRHCGKVLVVHEDSRTGGIGESLAAVIQEEAFEDLDAPVRVLGALDTPVPYSPPLERAFLPSEAEVERAARALVAY